MTIIGKLNGNSQNIRVQKCLITAKLANLEVDYNSDFKFTVDNQTDEYLKKFPLGQIPSFESKDGLLLSESSAIVFHFAKLQDGTPLLGKDLNEQAQVLQLCFYSDSQVGPPGIVIFSPFVGYTQHDLKVEENAYKSLNKTLAYLEGLIQDKNYFVGDQITVADIILWGAAFYPLTYFFNDEDRAQYPNLMRWVKSIAEIPEVKEFVGPLKLAKNRLKWEADTKPMFKFN